MAPLPKVQPRKFFIDIQNRAFVQSATTTLPSASVAFSRADTEAIELYFLRPSIVTPPYEYADYAASTVKLAVGNIGNPTSGTFKVTDGTGTTAALSFGVTAAQLKTALDATNASAGIFSAGACTVTGEMPRFIVTVGSDNTGAVSTLNTDDNELAPATNVRFIQRQAATASKPLIFDLVLERQPAVLTTNWTALDSTVVVTASTLVAGGPGTSEQQKYVFSQQPSQGSYAIKFPGRAITVSSVVAGIFTAPSHGLYDNQTVALSGFTITSSSFANISYYVVQAGNDTFRIATTAGGTAITAAASTGGTATLGDIVTGQIPWNATTFGVQQTIAEAGFNIGGIPQIIVTGIDGNEFILQYSNGSAGINFPQLEIVSSALSAPKGLSGTLDFNTLGVRDLIVSGQNSDLTLEVEATSSGSSTQTYQQSASVSSDIITAATQPTPPVTTFGTGYMRVETGITGLTGGGGTKLDGLITANGTYPTGICVFIVIGGIPQIWQLTSGTTAENANGGVVRPDDYAASTNEKVWLQRM